MSIEVFGHDVDYSSEEWVDLAGTHSDHHTLPPAQLAGLLADLRVPDRPGRRPGPGALRDDAGHRPQALSVCALGRLG